MRLALGPKVTGSAAARVNPSEVFAGCGQSNFEGVATSALATEYLNVRTLREDETLIVMDAAVRQAAHRRWASGLDYLSQQIGTDIVFAGSSRGGSLSSAWLPDADVPAGSNYSPTYIDYSGLNHFEQMLERIDAITSQGYYPRGFFHYQGEADAASPASYKANVNTLFDAVLENVPSIKLFIINQLANRLDATENVEFQNIRQLQKEIAEERTDTILVANHDLAMQADGLHLTNDSLAESSLRNAKAIAYHLYGIGSLPLQITDIARAGAVITITCNQTVSAGPYGDIFRANVTGGADVAISSAVRNGSDDTKIDVTLASNPGGTVDFSLIPDDARGESAEADSPRTANYVLPAFTETL